MKKTFIALTVAVIMAVSVLTGMLFAGENSMEKGSSGVHQHGISKEPSEEPKQAEEAKRSAEEAKKIIVARVNGAEINMFMLVRAMNRIAPKYLKEGEAATKETNEQIKNEALNRLIFEELAVQEAIRQGINPSPEAIDKVVAQVRESVGTEEAYREYLDKADLTEETLKKLVERSQRYELITAREIYGKISIDEKLLKDEYEKEKGKFILPDNFVAEDVFLLQAKDEDSAHKKVDEVLKSIRKNNNDVWKLVLDGTFIVRKINIRQEKHPAIYNAMTEMNVGDLSGVIQDKDGFHIIKVVKKDMSRPATFEEARGALEPKFLVPAQEQRKQEWERELKKDAKIEVMLDDVEKNIGIFGKQ
ncbi:MAG: peptidylprolyl isomerase [Thermodesulfovibrionales bacterium]